MPPPAASWMKGQGNRLVLVAFPALLHVLSFGLCLASQLQIFYQADKLPERPQLPLTATEVSYPLLPWTYRPLCPPFPSSSLLMLRLKHPRLLPLLPTSQCFSTIQHCSTMQYCSAVQYSGVSLELAAFLKRASSHHEVVLWNANVTKSLGRRYHARGVLGLLWVQEFEFSTKTRAAVRGGITKEDIAAGKVCGMLSTRHVN